MSFLDNLKSLVGIKTERVENIVVPPVEAVNAVIAPEPTPTPTPAPTIAAEPTSVPPVVPTPAPEVAAVPSGEVDVSIAPTINTTLDTNIEIMEPTSKTEQAPIENQ